MTKLVVDSRKQIAEIYDGQTLVASFQISTGRNGLGCEKGSLRTPPGKLRVAKKIGDGEPPGMIFKARVPTGEIWRGEESDEDLILTRILWLEGAEPANANTLERYIYLHGTNQEHLLGTPASHGCIRFSNADIIKVFALLGEGSEIEVI
jgi:UDP-N-acetylmuramate--alanine ligase